jgi:pilus assembly protein CpaC
VGTGFLNGASSAIPGSNGNLILNRPTAPNVFISIDNFALYMRFIEEEKLGRVLAEPKLVTMSGQEASFLAGGEFPYQTVDADGQTNTEFKDFGVGLRFTPVVGSDGLITLKVFPSVSEIASLVETSTGPQPTFNTRKLETMVQLRDGQTLALAGLLQDSLTETISKVPLLGDIPILGTLFRSTDYKSKKTDLLVAVTPHLIYPVQEGKISFPGEFIKPPNRFELYLEGRLEGRRADTDRSLLSDHVFTAPTSVSSGGMEGSFGHMESSQ